MNIRAHACMTEECDQAMNECIPGASNFLPYVFPPPIMHKHSVVHDVKKTQEILGSAYPRYDHKHYRRFTLRKPRSLVRINRERGFLRVSRL